MARNVEGLNELLRKFDALPGKLQAALSEGIDKSAEETAALLRARVPVHKDAPHIRDTIEIIEPHKLRRLVAIGSPELKYAAPLAWGRTNKDGSRTEGQQYFLPIYRFMQKRWRSLADRLVRKALREGWGNVE